MHATPIPMPEPVVFLAALGFILLCVLAAATTVALARRALRKGTVKYVPDSWWPV